MGCTSSKSQVSPDSQGKRQSRPSTKGTRKRSRRGKEPTQDLAWITDEEICNVRSLQDIPKTYPPPEPPPYNRDTYIQGVDFSIVDRRAKEASRDLQNDYTRLIEYLTDVQTNDPGMDLSKVRAILVWLAKVYKESLLNKEGQDQGQEDENYSLGGQSKKHFDRNDGMEENLGITNAVISNQNSNRTKVVPEEIHTPRGDLDLVNEGQVDIAILFAVLCRKGGIKCAVIRGQWKPDEYEVGGDITDGCIWNGAYVDGTWRLIHPLWSTIRNTMSASRDQDQISIENSKRTHEFDDYYFLTDPEEFVTRCLPYEEKWQLLQRPVPSERFQRMPRFTEEFFKLGLSLSRDKDGNLVTTNGRASVSIEFPPGRQPQLYYHISEMECDPEYGSGSSVVMDPEILRKCVYMFKKEDNYIFKLKFNKKGVYNLKIYGKRVTSIETEVDQIPLLCQLQIDCKDPDRTWRSLPDCPAIGWGQSGLAARLGVVPVSHKGGIAYTNEHRRVNFMFKVASDIELQAQLVAPNSHDALKDPRCECKGNKVTMVVVLPAKLVEVCLRISARSTDTEEFINVCNFIVKLQQQPLEKERARDRRLKNRLEVAMKSQNENMLMRAMHEYAMFIHTDTGELDRAEERLTFLRLKGNLLEAMQRQHVPHMEMAIYDAETSQYSETLKSRIGAVKALLQNLKRTATYQHHVLALNQSLLLEIRGYMKPKSIIYDVMKAALLLLGENRCDLNEWKYVKGTLSRTGRESIFRSMEQFDPTRVDSDRVREAEALWSPYTLEQVWEASAGAAVIHKWIRKTIDNAKSTRSRHPIGSERNGEPQTSRFDPEGDASPETDAVRPQRFSSEGSIERSNSRPYRKRKASRSLEDDSDIEVATARQISTEFVYSTHGSRTKSRDLLGSEDGRQTGSQGRNHNGGRDDDADDHNLHDTDGWGFF